MNERVAVVRCLAAARTHVDDRINPNTEMLKALRIRLDSIMSPPRGEQ